MNDWSSGYVTDVGYTYGYYSELNPARATYALLHAGIEPPEITAACELGFGQGMSVNLHAAASGTSWHANDFNPAQAAFARSLAEISGAGADLTDEAFDAFCARSDLPAFDYIGLHGIWSWISDDNRRVIVDFVRRKLKIGGVLYISYNTQPGWSAMMPMRHLLTEHAEVMGSAGRGIVSRIDGALEFAEKLIETNPIYARANPAVAERLKRIKEQNRHYLAHEYFNRDWQPMHFADMAEWLAPAKLEFACSTHYLDHLDSVNLSHEQQALLKEIADPVFRETVRDFCVNQQFRRDYWVKGARRLNGLQQAEAIRTQRILLTAPRADVTLKANGALGEADLSADIYPPIIEMLGDHVPRTIDEIAQSMKAKDIPFAQVVQAVLVLIGKGDVAPVQDEAAIEAARVTSDKLNAYLMDHARGASEINYLASPMTGGGVQVGRFNQLFLLAIKHGKQTPPEWASFVWEILAAQGQRLIKEGAPIESAEDNLAELTEQAQTFSEKTLPTLKVLQVA